MTISRYAAHAEMRRLIEKLSGKKEDGMGIASELREKARRLGSKRWFSCSKYLADEFGIECGEASCGECYACLFERIADRIEDEPDELRGLRDENERLCGMVREPQLPEGVEWPRFEDGELVRIGDELELEGKTWKVTGVGFESPGFDIGLRCGLNIGAMSGSYGERLKRPTPKVLDADGAPISVGDTVYLVDEDNGEPKACGAPLTVISFDCQQQTALLRDVGGGMDCYGNYSEDFEVAERLTHRKRPDSWERIEKDAAKRVCEYAGAQKSTADPDRYSCIECPYDDIGPHTDAECNERMRLDLVRRAKALAKAGE